MPKTPCARAILRIWQRMPACDSFFLTRFTSEPSAGENNIFMYKLGASCARAQVGELLKVGQGVYRGRETPVAGRGAPRVTHTAARMRSWSTASSEIEGPVHADDEVAVLAGVPPVVGCAAREEIAVTPFIAQAKPHFSQLVRLLRGGAVANDHIIVGTARGESRT